MLVVLDGTRPLTRERVGGKAFGLQRMRALGLPVPPAFCLPTAACAEFHAAGGTLTPAMRDALRAGVGSLERALGRQFGGASSGVARVGSQPAGDGDGGAPLLLSVRSGAARSMPGMMDTVLDLGLTDRTEPALAAAGGAAFAADSRARFVASWAQVVGGTPPEDPWLQLEQAAAAVFASWDSSRARTYRAHHGLGQAGGTAVTVQAMVFGNADAASGTGVLFSRNPLTGSAEPYGEYLPGGQGEDVVSGRHDPLGLDALADAAPALHAELLAAADRLEGEAGDVQDIEFTVESGRLWLLQTRDAKRAPEAAVRLAVLLGREGRITAVQALDRVGPGELAAFLAPRLAPGVRDAAEVLARGLAASPGLGAGRVVTDAEAAEDAEEDVVLVRPTTDPDDVHGMIAAQAVVTGLGGATSHAAVVSRELGRPCVVGCGAGALAALEGQDVTVDGGRGEVYRGLLPVETVALDGDPDLAQLRAWAVELGRPDPVAAATGATMGAGTAAGTDHAAAATAGAVAR